MLLHHVPSCAVMCSWLVQVRDHCISRHHKTDAPGPKEPRTAGHSAKLIMAAMMLASSSTSAICLKHDNLADSQSWHMPGFMLRSHSTDIPTSKVLCRYCTSISLCAWRLSDVWGCLS